VHVRIDQAGQQHLVLGELDVLPPGQTGRQRLDGHDHAIAHADAARHLARLRDHTPTTDHQIELGHACSVQRAAAAR
jgi:hypothetical protein